MTSDRVLLTGMRFQARHGVNPEEKVGPQPFRVDLEVELDLVRAGTSDRLEDTVNYSALYRAVRDVMEGEPRNLLESLAEATARRILDDFPVQAARVRVTKLRPPIRGAALEGAAAEVYRRRQQSRPTTSR